MVYGVTDKDMFTVETQTTFCIYTLADKRNVNHSLTVGHPGFIFIILAHPVCKM
jgi:hypothetical protein